MGALRQFGRCYVMVSAWHFPLTTAVYAAMGQRVLMAQSATIAVVALVANDWMPWGDEP